MKVNLATSRAPETTYADIKVGGCFKYPHETVVYLKTLSSKPVTDRTRAVSLASGRLYVFNRGTVVVPVDAEVAASA